MRRELTLLRRCVITAVLGLAIGLLIVPVALGANRFTVAPSRYLITVTVPVQTNTPTSVKVTALDSSGHTLTSFNSNSVTWSDSSGAVPPGTPLNQFVNGVSSHNMLDVTSPMRADVITVTDGTVTSHSAPFAVHGPLAKYVIVFAHPAQAGTADQVTVYAEDAVGDRVPGYDSNSVTWSDTSGAVPPGTPLNTFVNGVSSGNSITVAAPTKHDTITVTDGTVTSTATFAVYGTLSHFVIGFTAPISVNQSDTMNVLAEDAAGNVLRNYNSSSATWSDSSGAVPSGTPLNPFVHGNSYGNTFTVTASVSSDTFTVTDGGVTTSVTRPVANSAPTAGDVSYTGAIGNTTFGVGTTPSQPSTTTSGTVLSNSTAPGGKTITAVPGTIATANGGSVAMNSDGTFTYTPPAGYTGNDTFPFTITDGAGTSSATATITVANMVWYVNSGGADGNGTSTTPFSQLSEAASASSANQDIFLFGSTTSYSGGITLKSGQSLVGQSANLVVGGQTVSSATGSNPTITSSGTGVTLAEGTTVSGITVSGAATGMSATSLNSFTLASGDAITNSSGDGLDVSGGGGNINAGASISGSGGHSVSISSRTSGTVTVSGSINDTGSGLSVLNNNSSAEVDFTGVVSASTGPSPAFTAKGGGTVTAPGSGNTLTTSTATALDVENITIGAAGLKFESISAGSPSAGPVNAIILESTGTAGGLTVTGNGSAGTCGPVTSANPAPNCSGGTIYNSPGSTLSSQYAAVEVGARETSPSATAIPLGSLNLHNMQIAGVSGGGYGVYASTLSQVDIVGSYVSNEAGPGIQVTSWGGSNGTFDIDANTLVGMSGAPIDVVYSNGPVINTGTQSGYIENNIIGNPAVENSGSVFDNGISAVENGTGTMTAAITGNYVNGIEQWYGIQGATGHGPANITMTGNNVHNTEVYKNGSDIGSLDALDVSEINGPVCANITGNIASASNTNFQGAGYDTVGVSVGSDNPTAFQLQGYSGPANDSGGQVEARLNSTNTLSGPSNPTDESIAYDNGSTGALNFIPPPSSTCAVPSFSALGVTAPPFPGQATARNHAAAAGAEPSAATKRAESSLRARAWREESARLARSS